MTVGAIALTLLVMGPAQGAESPAVTTSVLGTSTTVPETTTTTVLDTSTTSVLGTSTTVEETTTTEAAGVIATTTTTTAEAPVAAGVTTRRLPRTGGDIGGAAVVGLALTGAGIALAYGARRRRVHAESA